MLDPAVQGSAHKAIVIEVTGELDELTLLLLKTSVTFRIENGSSRLPDSIPPPKVYLLDTNEPGMVFLPREYVGDDTLQARIFVGKNFLLESKPSGDAMAVILAHELNHYLDLLEGKLGGTSASKANELIADFTLEIVRRAGLNWGAWQELSTISEEQSLNTSSQEYSKNFNFETVTDVIDILQSTHPTKRLRITSLENQKAAIETRYGREEPSSVPLGACIDSLSSVSYRPTVLHYAPELEGMSGAQLIKYLAEQSSLLQLGYPETIKWLRQQLNAVVVTAQEQTGAAEVTAANGRAEIMAAFDELWRNVGTVGGIDNKHRELPGTHTLAAKVIYEAWWRIENCISPRTVFLQGTYDLAGPYKEFFRAIKTFFNNAVTYRQHKDNDLLIGAALAVETQAESLPDVGSGLLPSYIPWRSLLASLPTLYRTMAERGVTSQQVEGFHSDILKTLWMLSIPGDWKNSIPTTDEPTFAALPTLTSKGSTATREAAHYAEDKELESSSKSDHFDRYAKHDAPAITPKDIDFELLGREMAERVTRLSFTSRYDQEVFVEAGQIKATSGIPLSYGRVQNLATRFLATANDSQFRSFAVSYLKVRSAGLLFKEFDITLYLFEQDLISDSRAVGLPRAYKKLLVSLAYPAIEAVRCPRIGDPDAVEAVTEKIATLFELPRHSLEERLTVARTMTECQILISVEELQYLLKDPDDSALSTREVYTLLTEFGPQFRLFNSTIRSGAANDEAINDEAITVNRIIKQGQTDSPILEQNFLDLTRLAKSSLSQKALNQLSLAEQINLCSTLLRSDLLIDKNLVKRAEDRAVSALNRIEPQRNPREVLITVLSVLEPHKINEYVPLGGATLTTQRVQSNAPVSISLSRPSQAAQLMEATKAALVLIASTGNGDNSNRPATSLSDPNYPHLAEVLKRLESSSLNRLELTDILDRIAFRVVAQPTLARELLEVLDRRDTVKVREEVSLGIHGLEVLERIIGPKPDPTIFSIILDFLTLPYSTLSANKVLSYRVKSEVNWADVVWLGSITDGRPSRTVPSRAIIQAMLQSAHVSFQTSDIRIQGIALAQLIRMQVIAEHPKDSPPLNQSELHQAIILRGIELVIGSRVDESITAGSDGEINVREALRTGLLAFGENLGSERTQQIFWGSLVAAVSLLTPTNKRGISPGHITVFKDPAPTNFQLRPRSDIPLVSGVYGRGAS